MVGDYREFIPLEVVAHTADSSDYSETFELSRAVVFFGGIKQAGSIRDDAFSVLEILS
jgi:hypothetical protein